MGILAIYDVTGIQDYIYSSNKLKENLGASIIVQKVLDDYLKEAIIEVVSGGWFEIDDKTVEDLKSKISDDKLEIIKKNLQNNRFSRKDLNYTMKKLTFTDKEIKIVANHALSGTIIDWEEKDFQITKDTSIKAEVVYIGGGNALVVYKDENDKAEKDTFNKVTQDLSRRVLLETASKLRFAVAYITTNFGDYSDDREEIFKELNKNKHEMIQTSPLLGISITREGLTDGLPAQEKASDGYISLSAHLKRNISEPDYFKSLLEGYENYEFPKEFDFLGQSEGENHIAVVYIDGNNMGKMMENLLENDVDYNEAVKKTRMLSKQIREAYRAVMKEVIDSLVNSLPQESCKNLFDTIDGKTILPIRPVVLNGDEVTFVCNGKIGISCAETFLKKISKKNIEIDGEAPIPLSACAGVVIIKSHFPFYRAYQLAEELCHSAKTKGKIIAKNSEEEVGCWLDYHIVFSGITTELAELRAVHYKVPGMQEPEETLEASKHGAVMMKSQQYNLLWRPWCLAGEVDDKYKWENLKNICKEINKWPRSKLKALRNEFIKSEDSITNLINELKSRDVDLPVFDRSREPFRYKQTPYFDALELHDFYIELLS